MLWRALRRGAAPASYVISRQPFVLSTRISAATPVISRNARAVTTDAASSHAEREKVPQEDDKPFEVVLSDESFETYELDPPPYYLDTTKQELKQMYHDMVTVR
ncbi:MAG: hypothetical protein Q9162_004804 [Coniocarpon cinnabarinum]